MKQLFEKLKQTFQKLKTSKLFGISVMYFVAAVFAVCAIWATIYFYKEKDAQLEKANQANIELNEIQDSAANATIWGSQTREWRRISLFGKRK